MKAFTVLVTLALATTAVCAPVHASPQVSEESDCSTVNLDGPRGPLRGMPIFNQLGGTCWAHAAIELAEAWRRSHPPVPPEPAPIPEPSPGGLKHISSPLALAEAMAHESGQMVDFNKGEGVWEALDYLGAHGSCNHSALFGNGGAGLDMVDQKKLVDFLSAAYRRQGQWNIGNKDWLLSTVLELKALHPEWDWQRANLEAFYQGALQSGASRQLCSDLALSYAGVQYPQPFNSSSISDLLAAMLASNDSLGGFVDDYFRKVCDRNHIPLSLPQSSSFSVVPDGDFFRSLKPNFRTESSARKVIDAHLLAPNPQPVGIAFCSDVIESDVEARHRQLATSDKLASCSNHDEHAVIIIGRRWDDKHKKCSYKIRNSWGIGCASFKDSWDCDDRGQIWVDSDALLANTLSVDYLGK